MPKDDVSELINRIRTLRVQEDLALAALEVAHRRAVEEHRNRNPESSEPPRVPSSASSPSPGTAHEFAEGDAIVIRNKVVKPLNRPLNRGDRTGIVTSVTRDRIYFRTSNGTNTWRASHNLRIRSEHE